jgi:hypothetical protein
MYDRTRVRRPGQQEVHDPRRAKVERVDSPLLRLQRAVGNQAAATALRVGAVDSPAERQADLAAARFGGLQRTADPAPAAPSAGLAGLLRRARGGGRPVDDATRERLAPAVGGDLADVRLHTDETAARMSAELGARAFTSGQDVFFGAGERQAGGDALLAHEAAHATQDAGADVVHRFPANVLSAPNVGWARQTGGGRRPGEGVSGGVYILSSANQDDPVKKVVVKPVYAEANQIGNVETGEQLSFADQALSSLLGISTPASRVVNKGTAEFGELLQVCRPYAPARPTDVEEAKAWKDLGDAESFIVMGEVPNAKTLSSLATQAGQGDTAAMDELTNAIFDPDFIAQLGRLAVGDLLIGNNDRMVGRAMNLGNIMVSTVDGKGQVHAIDSLAALDKFDAKEILAKGSSSSTLQGGFTSTEQTFLDKDDNGSIVDGFYRVVGRALDGLYGKSENTPAPEVAENTISPRMLVEMMYETNREGLLAGFDRGWDEALAQVRALLSTKEGREKMKALTGPYEGTEVEGGLSYDALKANAMYLSGRSEGKTHQQSAMDPAALAASKQLAGIRPTDFEVPIDEFHWSRMPRLSSSVATADLEEIRALPSSKAIIETTTGRSKSLQSIPSRVQLIGRRAQEAKVEVDDLGTKSRGMFKKKDKVRNRSFAGYAVADAFLLGTGSLRGSSTVNQLLKMADIVSIAAAGNLKASQAQAALPAARTLVHQQEQLTEDMANYAGAAKTAAKDIGKLKKYGGRTSLVNDLADIAGNAEKAVGFLADLDRMNPAALLQALQAKANA